MYIGQTVWGWIRGNSWYGKWYPHNTPHLVNLFGSSSVYFRSYIQYIQKAIFTAINDFGAKICSTMDIFDNISPTCFGKVTVICYSVFICSGLLLVAATASYGFQQTDMQYRYGHSSYFHINICQALTAASSRHKLGVIQGSYWAHSNCKWVPFVTDRYVENIT